MSQGRTPPQDIQAEQAVIGSCLIDPDKVTELAAMLAPDDFSEDKHQVIWATMLAMHDDRTPIDAVTLPKALTEKGHLERAGGLSHVVTVARSVPTAAHAMHYARQVKEASVRRRLIREAALISSMAHDSTVELEALADEAERRILGASSLSAFDPGPRPIGPVAAAHWRELYDARDRRELVGLPTGFAALDGKLVGLQPGDLTVLAARTSLGKTSLALAIARTVAARQVPVVLFSLEMSARQIAERLISMGAEINMRDVRARRLTDERWEAGTLAIAEFGATPLWVDDRRGQSTHSIVSKARRVKGVGLVVIDYLGLIRDPEQRGETRAQHVGQQVKRIRDMAGNLGCPVLLLCQLNREPEGRADKKPQLSDVRESGDIEQDADNVLLLWHDPKHVGLNKVTVIVAKQRNGPTGEVCIEWEPEFVRFRTDNIQTPRKPELFGGREERRSRHFD
ncbi:MAG: replicative DNA helicase [Bacillota bacterium]|jgi:replicative DNA helicase|nr:MAG: replicative DNA helicase [Bacillota bacterium]